MDRVVITTRSLAAFLVAAIAAAPVAAAGANGQETVPPPAGLDTFLSARLLESEGRYREALEGYGEALEARPESGEVRIVYAALLAELGLADAAVQLLDGRTDLDWYGRRTLAMALAQQAARRPETLPAAAQALEQALSERDDDPQVQLALAQVLERQGDLAGAEQVVAEIRAARGSHPQLAAFHGSLLQRLGRLEEAAEAFEVCAGSDGGQAAACRQGLRDTLVALGRPAEAGESMLAWLAEDDLDGLLQAATLLSDGGRTEQALRTVRRVLAVEPGSVRAQTLEALLLSALGRWEDALTRLTALQRRAPDDLDVLLPLAWAKARGGRTDEARGHLERAWQVAARSSSPRTPAQVAMTAARIELATGHPLVAREWLDRLGDPEPGGPDLVRLLALTYRRTEQWREAIGAMLRLQPRLTGAARLQATAFEAECRMRLGEANGMERLRPLLGSSNLDAVFAALGVLQTLERWPDLERELALLVERFPANRQLRFARAAAFERQGRIDEATAIFLELLAESPDDAASANYVGYMWADRGERLEEALRLIRRAVELEPDNPAYQDSLGWVHFRLGNLDEAERWLRLAADGAPGDATVLAHLGEVVAALGRAGEARRILQQALDLGPEDPAHVRQLLETLGNGPSD